MRIICSLTRDDIHVIEHGVIDCAAFNTTKLASAIGVMRAEIMYYHRYRIVARAGMPQASDGASLLVTRSRRPSSARKRQRRILLRVMSTTRIAAVGHFRRGR